MRDREKAREAERKYRAANLEKVRAVQAESKRKARAKNPEAARAYKRAFYAKHRERIREHANESYPLRAAKEREASRIYRLANPEKTKSAGRKWREANRAKVKASRRAWYEANQPLVKASRRRRRARIEGAAVNDLTAAQWRAIQELADHCCAYCGKRRKGRLTQDHIIPLTKGGNHTASNIVPACGPCNSTKHTGPPLCPVQPVLL